MADEKIKTEDSSKAPKLRGLMTVIKAIAFVSVVVMLEMAAASMLIPSAEETQAIGEKLAAAKKADELAEKKTPDDQTADAAEMLGDMVEVNLGSHHVLSYNPETGTSLNVDFELWATVHQDEETEFAKLYDSNQQRISEQVNITVRGMDVTDFTDPQAGLLKRTILEKTNRALGKPLLHDALLVDFSFVER